MTKQTTLITLIVLLVLAGLFWWGKANQTAPNNESGASAGALVSEETFHDFGSISMAKGNVSKTFTLKNPTDAPVTISAIATSCMCTEAFLETPSGDQGPFGMPGHGLALTRTNEVVAPGESRNVRVVFNPNAHGPAGVGLIERLVEIADAEGKAVRLQIKAVVTP